MPLKRKAPNKATKAASKAEPPPDKDSFYYFAINNFTAGTSHCFSRGDARQPVLTSTPPADRKVALTLWKCILKFMGDITDLRQGKEYTCKMPNLGSVMSRLYQEYADNTAPGATQEDPREPSDSDSSPSPRSKQSGGRGTLRRVKATLTPAVAVKVRSTVFHDLPLEDTLISRLDLLHYIVGNGILRPSLRDELYCILCKQLTDNPFKMSVQAGWLLFSHMAACFTPSERILKYVLHFISNGPPIYATGIQRVLQSCMQTGSRYQPTSSLELKHSMDKTPLELSVTLMDGTSHNLAANGTTTARQLCESLRTMLKLKEGFGFSIYVAMYGKVASLGSGNDHVLDAVSQCEQIHRDADGNEADAPWRLFFRKETFAPWERPADDHVSTRLVYAQIVRGVLLGEYVCDTDETLSTLAAQHVYVQHGQGATQDMIRDTLQSIVPKDKLETKQDDWVQSVHEAYLGNFGEAKTRSKTQVQQDIVKFAQETWSPSFSQLYDAILLEGLSPVPDDGVMRLAVNSQGVDFIGKSSQAFLHLSFPQIATVQSASDNRSLSIEVLDGSVYRMKCLEARHIRAAVVKLIEGLLARSRYAVALQYSGSDSLQYEPGDLLLLRRPGGEEALTADTCEAKNPRSGDVGIITSDRVHVLPTCERPNGSILDLFKPQPRVSKEHSSSDVSSSSSGSSTHMHWSNVSSRETLNYEATARRHSRETSGKGERPVQRQISAETARERARNGETEGNGEAESPRSTSTEDNPMTRAISLLSGVNEITDPSIVQ